MFSNASVYDLNNYVFSPHGGLLQIDYAQAAADKGGSAVAVKTEDAVFLVAERSRHNDLLVNASLDKIRIVSDHVVACYSGVMADANILLEKARVEAANHFFTYDEPMSVNALVKAVGQTAYSYADPDLDDRHRMYARPFGVSILFAGLDKYKDEFKDEEGRNWTQKKDGHKVAKESQGQEDIGKRGKGHVEGKAKKGRAKKGKAKKGRAKKGKAKKGRGTDEGKQVKEVENASAHLPMPKLYLLSPGSEEAVRAAAIGAGKETANKDLLANHATQAHLTEAQALALCLRSIKGVAEESALETHHLEVAKIDRSGLHVYADAEVADLMKKYDIY